MEMRFLGALRSVPDDFRALCDEKRVFAAKYIVASTVFRGEFCEGAFFAGGCAVIFAISRGFGDENAFSRGSA